VCNADAQAPLLEPLAPEKARPDYDDLPELVGQDTVEMPPLMEVLPGAEGQQLPKYALKWSCEDCPCPVCPLVAVPACVRWACLICFISEEPQLECVAFPDLTFDKFTAHGAGATG